MSALEAQPRYIRAMKAPAYLGMDRELFNALVRPHLIEIPIGVQGLAFDRLELDEWADEYKRRNGRRSATGSSQWQRQQTDSRNVATCGTSTNTSADAAFAKALARATTAKPNATSRGARKKSASKRSTV